MVFPSCTRSLLQLSEQHLDIYWCQQTNSPYGGLRSRAVAPASGTQGLPVAHTPEQSKAKCERDRCERPLARQKEKRDIDMCRGAGAVSTGRGKGGNRSNSGVLRRLGRWTPEEGPFNPRQEGRGYLFYMLVASK